VLPHDLPEEVDDLWGPEVERYERIVALLERGALAVTTESGAYLAHAGFPSRRAQGALRQLLKDPTEELLADILWRDPAASRLDRGVAPPFTEVDLSRFLAEVGASVFVRGHDPDVVGRSLYGDRCLTLHTTRVYERYGGVLLARLPLDHRVRSVSELRVEHLPVEGRSYSPDL
jgi:hypothetical protein